MARHQHDEKTAHIVVVMKGAVMVRDFENGKVVAENVVRAGEILDGDAPMDHEIEAIEDGSKIFNVIKGKQGQ